MTTLTNEEKWIKWKKKYGVQTDFRIWRGTGEGEPENPSKTKRKE